MASAWVIRDIESDTYWTHEDVDQHAGKLHWFTNIVGDAHRFTRVEAAREQLKAIEDFVQDGRLLELVLLTGGDDRA